MIPIRIGYRYLIDKRKIDMSTDTDRDTIDSDHLRKDTTPIVSLCELKVLGILLPEYKEMQKQLYDGLVSEEEVAERYGPVDSGIRQQLEALIP